MIPGGSHHRWQQESDILEPILIVGAGYVGLGTATALVERGHRVWCVDDDARKIELLNQGVALFTEPGLWEILGRHGAQVSYVTDQRRALAESGARLVFVAVGTPSDDDGSADLTQVERAVDAMPRSSDLAIVMKSTVPPGTGVALVARARRQGKEFAYVSCPEFLQEGEALRGLRRPDRVVIGALDDCWAARAVRQLHDDLGTPPIFVETSVTSAEMIKHASNLQLAMRISYANQIANLCEEVGADSREVLHGVGLDTRIGPEFLIPGVGFGGSCLTKDVQALKHAADQLGYDLSLADAVLEVNELQAERVIDKLKRRLDPLSGRKVALLGLAFKPGTDDLRDGRGFVLARRLRDSGARLSAWDPNHMARANALQNAAEPRDPRQPEWIAPEEMADSLYGAFRRADACVLVTECEEFKAIDWRKAAATMAGDLVLDGPNVLRPQTIRDAGLTYEGTGRHSQGLAHHGRRSIRFRRSAEGDAAPVDEVGT